MASSVRGGALLEAVVGLAILSVAGAAVIGLVAGGLASESRAAVRERMLEEAERLLAGTVLLDRGDLDRRLGAQVIGAFAVVVTRPEPTLYRLSIAAAEHPESELLTTIVYRARVQ